MLIEYGQEYLRELYEKGKTSDKKHRFQPEVVRGYQKAVRFLCEADKVEDLFRFNSLNYEALSGDKKGVCSVRANGKYRVEFTTREVAGEKIVTICRLLELSNHYK